MKAPTATLLVLAFTMLGVSLPAAQAKENTRELIAILTPTKGNKVMGMVTFTELPDKKIKVAAHIEGLEPNSKHGFHIHEYGDLSKPDGTGTGGHFNPEKHEHALPDHKVRHAGDFGNLEANAQGIATLDLVVDNITLRKGKDAIIGRGIIVHEKPDDGGQPTGNAGARLAQGVIGVKNTAPAKP